jgi:hypothetical protein
MGVAMFVDRVPELAFLNAMLEREQPGPGQFVMTGQWYLQPLPFGVLRQFLPGWSPDEQVAAYAIVGGIPAYLSWLNPRQTLTTNIKNVMIILCKVSGYPPHPIYQKGLTTCTPAYN